MWKIILTENLLEFNLNTLVVKAFCTPVSGQGGVPMDPNSEKYFPEWIWQWNSYHW